MRRNSKDITKQEMMDAAAKNDFIYTTDGDWCSSTSPETFKRFIESKGFEVVDCRETKGSSARATTSDGFIFCYNGYCYTLD